ncbi:MAG: glycosyl hydrolase family 5 [Flaviaesturariibacter sp.]|nr:glycosyl hydrolase family 5 [Flaviaesturariibacter sp.]
MKRSRLPIFYTVVFFLLTVLYFNDVPAQGFLKASGKRIVDETGKEILLRGMGLGGWMLQEPYMLQLNGSAYNQGDFKRKIIDLIGRENTTLFYDAWLKNFCTKTDIDSMAVWGFNSIRLPMHYNLFTLPIEEEPIANNQTWLPKGFQMVDSLLSWCRSNKIYLILDLHAAPGGQGTDFAISDRDTTKPSLWQNEANQVKTVALWRKLAERYVNEPWIGGYDLINETNWGFQNAADKNGCAETENIPLRKHLIAITDAIRQVDKNHLIFIEANCWANNYKGILPTWDANMAISFHKYWNNNDQASIQQFIDFRNQYNIPVWMGESGENSNSWFRSAISLLERNNIGWAWWPHKKMGMNNPFQIKTNSGYQQLIKYLKGEGSQPTQNAILSSLLQLAEDSKAEKTIYHKDVVDAMFRQISSNEAIAFKKHNITSNTIVFAVDYDMGPIGQAYFSKDSANYWVSSNQRTQWNKGWMYRNDGVDIEECKDSLSNGFQVTAMQPSEWLQYTIVVGKEAAYDLQLRALSTPGATISLFVNGREIVPNIAINSSSAWHTAALKNIKLKKGINKIRVANTAGEFSLNYLQFLKH